MDPVLIYIAIFGLILGLVVGMTSIGKGLIGTPGLVFLGVSSTTAVGTVGVAGIFMMLSSALKHFRNKNVNMKAVWAFSITAIPGSYLFAHYKSAINEKVPLTNIIAVAIILSVITLVYKFFLAKNSYESADGCYDEKNAPVWSLLLLGAILGFFIGATSISGSLIVIAFMLILKMPEALAIGTTNCVAIFSLAAASVAHIMEGSVDWVKLAIFTPAVMIGAYVGSGLTTKVPQKPLRIIILALLFVAGIGIFFKNGKDDDQGSSAKTETPLHSDIKAKANPVSN